jgi:predicted nucleotidyltransferase
MDMPDDWLRELRSWAKDNGSVRELWLFGSRAQGCAQPDSDVDLALALVPSKKANDDRAFTNYFFSKDQWKQQLEDIVGRHVSLETISPDMSGPDWDSMVRCFGIRLWSRDGSSSHPMPTLILKRATASRQGGEWNDDDYDVLADGVVFGRIFHAAASPVGTPWMWTLGYGHHEDRAPTHGYAETREQAMAAFAKSWRRE